MKIMSEIKIIQDKMRELGIKGISRVKENPTYYYVLFRKLEFEHEHNQEFGWLQVNHYRFVKGKYIFPFRCPSCKNLWNFFYNPNGYMHLKGIHKCKICSKIFTFNAAFISKDEIMEVAGKMRSLPNLCKCGKERGIRIWCEECEAKAIKNIKNIGTGFVACGNSIVTFCDLTYGPDPYKPFREGK